jgi:replicative DNA helicase
MTPNRAMAHIPNGVRFDEYGRAVPPEKAKQRPKSQIYRAVGVGKDDRDRLDRLEVSYGNVTGFDAERIEAPRIHKTGVGCMADLGIGPGRITLFGAPPKEGKTDLVTQLAIDAVRAQPDLMAIVANAEMNPSVLMARQVARLSGVPIERFTRPDPPQEIQDRVRRAEDELHQLGHDDDASGYNFSEGMYDTLVQFGKAPFNTLNLAVQAAEVEHYAGRRPDQIILVVDYIQLFAALDRSLFEKWKRVCAARRASIAPPLVYDLGQVMAELRLIAQTGVSVIVVSALAREAYDKAILGGFRGGSDLEYAVDDAFVLTREGMGDVVRLCHVASRNNAPKDRLLKFDGSIHKFSPAD